MSTTVLAAADQRLVAGLIVVVILAVIVVFLIGSALFSTKRRSSVPPSLRPGPSDEELENRTLPRILAGSTIGLMFMALFIPAYFLREPTRIKREADKFAAQSIDRGSIIFLPPVPGSPHFSANCARCHGAKGEGSTQPFKEILTYAEPPLKYIVSRYKAAGKNDDDIRQLIRDAIERGRPGPLMPTWGLAFGGPLNSQQVDDVINYIYSIQVDITDPVNGLAASLKGMSGRDIFIANCNVCHSRPMICPTTSTLSSCGVLTNNFAPDKTTPAIGQGGTGPDLRFVLSKMTRDEVFLTIHDGRLNQGRPSMPSWAWMGKSAIDSVIDFLRTIQLGPIKQIPSVPSPLPTPSSS
ncbi:MAG: c-type cytochrome [Actinomycetota bacterium]